ncbi:nuclear pore protein 84/107 [Irpex rosettiformis]|uniref:Nuclear pore protein 84/107 n=1 Tax=Irpex rosettiformis TaxID=378272 RepID=A0ACB8TVE5_9APHY|nr:nuclear pore protein 84/107 [Irpex rosettiformis]
MAHTLYTSCAEVLSLAQSRKDDISFLLDPEAGFAPKIRQICQDTIAEAEASGTPLSAEEVNALRLESDTWGLLQAIMPLRKTQPPRFPCARELLARNPYTPTSTLAESIMHSSRLLTELVVVREWLHDTAPEPPALDATTGYWKFTKHQMMQNLRLHKQNSLSGMDPDAVNKGDGGLLAPDDVVYEKALVSALYGYIRAGRLDDAIELCNKADQPWRAASIRGSILFQWRAVANEPRDGDSMDESDDTETWQGNRRRRLWKNACTRAALNPNLSDTERALYAALAPTPQTSTQLKNVCHTWEDHLWAQISVVCEEKESEELSKLTGSFWECGGPAPMANNVRREDMEEIEDDEWVKEVVESLESLANVTVQEGSPSDGLYHTSQLHIILDRTESLLEQFVEGLRTEAYTNMPEYPTLTRFFAHLCLYLQMIDVSPPPLATQVILEAYLRVLEEKGQRELIAMYAGALGDNAVERYAMFLTSLELSADIAERRLALTRAREHGLDMERVAVATAERTIERAFSVLPAPRGSLPVVSAPQPGASDEELLLVRSIEWTTFMDSTYDTALEQAVVILRYLLGGGRLKVAKSLLEVLPTELASIREPEERSVEYMHYRQFFMVWETLNRVVETQALEVPQMTKETRAAWLSDYKTLVQQAREQVIRLLTTDWLVTDADRAEDDRRLHDLLRIRQIFIPELILRLHTLLLESRWRIPENLQHTLDLANIVADSRYRLYDDFANVPQRKLSDYLLAVRQAILGGLEGGGSDPFRIVTL